MPSITQAADRYDAAMPPRPLHVLVTAASGFVASHVVQQLLAAGHRVSDGHRGALFLAALGRLLQEPQKLA